MIAFIVATIITILPVNSPHIDWGNLPLEQQMALIEMWRPDPPTRQTASRPPPRPSAQVGEPWFQPLIEKYFQPADWQWAARVSLCESGWRVDAQHPRSKASGLFQIMPGWYNGEWSKVWPPFDPFDPETNVKFAAWLFYAAGPSHWVCK